MHVCSIPVCCALALFLVISIAVKAIYRTANAAHHKHMICHVAAHTTAFGDFTEYTNIWKYMYACAHFI